MTVLIRCLLLILALIGMTGLALLAVSKAHSEETVIKCIGEGCKDVMANFRGQAGQSTSGAFQMVQETLPEPSKTPPLSERDRLIGFSIILGLVVLVLWVFLSMIFRVVVKTNDVHIVQSAKRTVSYGKDQPAGNTYYQWPPWVPVIGVRIISLPVSVFDVDLNNYAAYDRGRVPFQIDIMAFFRIKDSNLAAQRVSSFEDMTTQLEGILKGAIRSILATSEIEEILEQRAQFGERFTQAVEIQLEAWGVMNVKNIELMDIRDAEGSQVIANIMAKKKSLIEKESRMAVADNRRAAQEAEIVAQRAVDIQQQDAQRQVGERTAEKEKQVGIASEKAHQAVFDEAKVTATKHLAVQEVERVRASEIERSVQVVAADQQRQTFVIKAEGEKQQTITIAEGKLQQATLHAQGVEIEGKAQGEAEKAVLLAPVVAQITLAKEIGTNEGYQKYLVEIREIEKNEVVGKQQAEALQDAKISVIANAGTVPNGVQTVMDLFTSKGGTQLAAMAEAFSQTEAGKQILDKATGKK